LDNTVVTLNVKEDSFCYLYVTLFMTVQEHAD